MSLLLYFVNEHWLTIRSAETDQNCVKYLSDFLWALLDTPVHLIVRYKFDSPFVAFMAARCVDGEGGRG